MDEYEAQIAELKQQLSISQSESNTAQIQLNVTQFQLKTAISTCAALEHRLVAKDQELSALQAKALSEADNTQSLLALVNNIRARFTPEFPRLLFNDFADLARSFLDRLAARIPAPWASDSQQITQLKVQPDEVSSANREYAEEARDLRKSILQQQEDIQKLKASSKDSQKYMADFFISRLPAGHPVKDIARAAATTTIRNEKMVVAAPESLVTALRRQCAAVIWVRSDVYSLKNLEKLNLTDRAFLLKLFGLPAGGTAKIQAKRIDDHVAKHPLPAADGQQGNGGGGGGGGGGGQGNGGGHGAPANDGDGGADGGGGVQQHDGGGAVGLAGALLPSDQADALHRTARPEILRMLKAA